MSDKIILKVQNLLELAYDAPNDEEGQSALLMAQKLMVKHNLAMSDIQKIHKNNIGETVAASEYRMVWWKEKLAGILGANFRCKVIRQRKVDEGITKMIFFGYDSDAEFCTKVYEGAVLYLEYRLKRLFPTITKARWKDYKKSYLFGFLTGLNERFEKQTQSSEEFALMVQVPAEVLEEQYKRMGKLNERSTKIPIQKVDMEAYSVGLEHAKETKLMTDELLNS
ncbi:DUF2786 domain-containing protein [Streptococcus sp. DTU_2020_1000888_1_SI_GRL_NUU_041A]|uniref:DUF2786 domain-containing protein n=1 Tax=Streptococcus sp. DTU_2020_1000888_1_SI_GRL_NUU_041A TaxID=3077723 RepID=UPI0028E944BA|nr:DUF2786 domain-containing protein [Streptococcus sp. DTU_2020_1000888_1_SI_GRL_NUU_041A]WNU95488.1 DUF2786 domain-containing protein [Streptococcus sp. DTU_2020_1000888_1_SI_GRL_NUU_041A]